MVSFFGRPLRRRGILPAGSICAGTIISSADVFVSLEGLPLLRAVTALVGAPVVVVTMSLRSRGGLPRRLGVTIADSICSLGSLFGAVVFLGRPGLPGGCLFAVSVSVGFVGLPRPLSLANGFPGASG